MTQLSSTAQAPVSLEAVVSESSSTTRSQLLSTLKTWPVMVSLLVLVAVILIAIGAPLLTSIDPTEINPAQRLRPISPEHWLGTDAYGRDVYTRILYGARVSLVVGLGVAAFSLVVGLFIGVLAGYFRWVDAIVMRVMDGLMAIPGILLAIALVSILGGSMVNVILALSIVYVPRFARISRASTLVIRELPFVEASRALGSSTRYVIVNHVLRNIVSPITVQATFIFAYAMLAEAGLSFLGVGIDPATPTWGTMINEGRQFIDQATWLIVFPGLAISISVLSLQIIGDGLRDALDPRLAKDM